MADPNENFETGSPRRALNPGYPASQLAKALKFLGQAEDEPTRHRAEKKVSAWQSVLRLLESDRAAYGSRAPITDVPCWATLDVSTGGFATGGLLAGGPLQEHEMQWLALMPEVHEGDERKSLNSFFLTGEGNSILQTWLLSGCYEIRVPEEGALLTAAWLAANGQTEKARDLIEQLLPFFPILRFYPVPTEKPQGASSRLHLENVAGALASLHNVKPNPRIQAQKEAVDIWLPLYDQMLRLFQETVEDGWPCRKFTEEWRKRAQGLLLAFSCAKENHLLPSKFAKANKHGAQLLSLLTKCVQNPNELSGREVGRIRVILQSAIRKRGIPGSPEHHSARVRQSEDVKHPGYHLIARTVAARLEPLDHHEGIDDVGPFVEPVRASEAASSGLPEGTPIPPCLQ